MDLEFSVSRETFDNLQAYSDLVKKWNPVINLVSKASIDHLWDRHIRDCIQVYPHASERGDWVDIGSGGGFPGLIVAILARERNPDRRVTMIESDVRKSTFLRNVIRELDLPASVIIGRIEQTPPVQANVLSARALADLTQLLHFAQHHLAPGGQALFFKGETWEKEVETARKSWSFDLIAHKSETNTNSAILEVKDIQLV